MNGLALVVPCFNEAARLPVAAFHQAWRERSDLAFLFVDDGSADATAGKLESLVQAGPTGRAALLCLERNQGKAAAVRAGVLAARERYPDAAWLGFWDADLSTPFSELDRFQKAARDHPDATVLIGSRVQLLGRNIARRAARHVTGRVFATCASWALGLRVYDTQCGAKLFDADVAGRLFAEPMRSRWLLDVELLARLIQSEGRAAAEQAVVEIPLGVWTDVDGSKVRLADYPRAAAELLDLWRTYLR